MTSLVIRDLEQSVDLDRQAMRQIVGGSTRMSSALLERNLSRASFVATKPLRASNVQWSPLLRPVRDR
jgi:hypothetical protein